MQLRLITYISVSEQTFRAILQKRLMKRFPEELHPAIQAELNSNPLIAVVAPKVSWSHNASSAIRLLCQRFHVENTVSSWKVNEHRLMKVL
jgi:predicted DNA-binding ribbon-helix-helix protein